MIESEGIYLDLKALRRLIKVAQFQMEKSDRAVFAMPVMQACTEAITAFELAYDFAAERVYYAKKLRALCTVIKLDCEDMNELNVIKTNDERSGRTATSTKLEITRLVGSIDRGIGRYVMSSIKGKTAVVETAAV